MLAKNYFWLSIVLAAGTAWAYAGTLENGFVDLDDNVYVYQNPMVRRGLSGPGVAWAFRTLEYGNWHPLTWLSLEADRQFFGLGPRGFHRTNVVLHVANTVLLFWAVRLMTGAALRSAWVAAFFALHPLHVESVAWVAGRKDVLSTFFLFLCLLAWLAYVRRPAVWKYALSVVLFALSLMAKAMGVTLPLVLLLLDFWPLARWPGAAADREERIRNAISLVIEKLPFFLLSAAMTALGVFAQAHGGAMVYGRSLPVASRILLVPVNYLTYLGQMFWPVDLAVLYPHPGADLPWWKPLSALAALALITLLVLRRGGGRPYLPVGWLWFLIALLPVIGLVQIGCQATADRYMYLPMVGLLIAFCWALDDLAGERGWRPAALGLTLAICLLSCAALTTRQIAVWHDTVTLWKNDLKATGPNEVACEQYGMALAGEGRAAEAESQFRQALQFAPTAFGPNAKLGVALVRQRRFAEAAPYLLAALRARPKHPELLERLGMVEETQGHLDAAIGYYERAAQLAPNAPRLRERLERVRERLAEQRAADGPKS